ncbi:MAG: MgtC/SapB family protein [Armatimonadetes bacterium]|nr:MgtC/SapB family protein [Armatimonadota bacterium]
MPPLDWPLVATVLAKLAFAAVLGGVIGLEREQHGRPAGIRTHMLLILGVTLFAEVSKAFPGEDKGRIASQIVTGVGFLGAGTILRLGAEIKGLTTAASLWSVSAIGMAVSTGGSFLLIALFGTVLTYVTLKVVDDIERRLAPDAHPRELTVRLVRFEALTAVIEGIERAGGNVTGVRFRDGRTIALMDVKGDRAAVLKAALGTPDVVEAVWNG